MRILHIDLGLGWRGGQRQSLTLHKSLEKLKYESLYVCQKSSKLESFVQENKVNNVKTIKISKKIFGFNSREFEKIVDTWQPDIIHCHDSPSVSLLKKKYLRKLTFHTRRVSYPINIFSRIFKYSNIKVHVGVSSEITNYMNNYFQNTHLINSCIDISRFKNKKPLNPFDSSIKNILFVGAFTHQKGIKILIDAFYLIHQNLDNVHLNLVGEGPLKHEMINYVEELNLKEKVNFFSETNAIEGFFLNCDTLVMPSVDGEGSSGVIKEGIAAGAIVIASSLQCNSEIIRHLDNGILFKSMDPISLSKFISKVLKNEIKIPKQQITNSAKKFECSIMVQEYIHLYKKYFEAL